MAIDLSSIKKKEKKQKSIGEMLNEILQSEISLGGKKLSLSKKEHFYSQIQVLLTAGIDLRSALDIYTGELGNNRDKQIFSDIQKKLIAGGSLSNILKDSGRFTEYEYYSIQIGEETGRLKEVFRDLSDFYKGRMKQRRQLTGALTYPILVLIISLGVVIFMLNFIVPTFAEVFQRFDRDLPPLTKRIMGISDFVNAHLSLLLFILATIIVLILFIRNNPSFKKYYSFFILKIPFINRIVKKIYMSRFCQTMTLLVSSQTPILQSLEMVEKMIQFYPLAVSLKNVRQQLMKGQSLHQSLAKNKFIDSRIASMVKVGEEVNRLDYVFDNLFKQYSDELEHQTGMLSSLLEPFLIIFVGAIILTILIAMYMPLFQLSTNVF
jgi:type IV pilus assembly protein PilC